MAYYLTIPTGITLPADGAKVDLSAAAELHRDDSAVPNALTVDNGEYNVFLCSAPTTETAAVPGTPLAGTLYGATTTLTDQTVNTFSGLDFGAADASRVIEVMIMAWDNTGPRTIPSVTIGGVTATQVVAYAVAGSNPTGTAVYRATVPTGATGDIVVTFSGAVARCQIAWARIVGGTLQTSASDKKTSAQQTVNVNVGAGNTVVCLVGGRSLASINLTGMAGADTEWAGSSSSRVGGVVDNAATAGTPRTVTQTITTSDSALLYVSVWS